MQKDKVKSIIYNIKGKPNFNGYRGTLYESKYKKYFLYNGAEKAFKENEDNKMILDTENNKLYINGSEFTEPTFSQLDVDKPIQDGLICWLDGYDKNENTAENLWRSRVGNNHFALTGVTYDETSGWQDDGSFKFDTESRGVMSHQMTLNDISIICRIPKIDSVDTANSQNRLITIPTWTSGVLLKLARDPNYLEVMSNVFDKSMDIKMHVENDIILALIIKDKTMSIFMYDTCIIKNIKFTEALNLGKEIYISQSGGEYTSKFNLKSFLLYNRALTPEEVKHNYIYERYYRDKQKEINLNVRPLVQEIGINEGISIANDSHKEITVNSDGTFSNSDNTISGQKVRHIVNRRKICNRNIAKQSEFMFGRDEFQISPTKISDTAWRLIKKLNGTEEYLHGYFRHAVSKQTIYTVSFYVVKMSGVWSYASETQVTANISLGWNKISITPAISKVIGFYCNNTCLEGELIFEHYKCEEGNIFTGMNDTEYDLYEEEYVEGLYRGIGVNNLNTNQNAINSNSSGLSISNITAAGGWNEATLNGTVENIWTISIGNSMYLELSDTITASIEVELPGFNAYKVCVAGQQLLGDYAILENGKYIVSSRTISDYTATPGGFRFFLRIEYGTTLVNQKIRWRNIHVAKSKIISPFVNTSRITPKQIFTVPKVSGITSDLFSVYINIYKPYKDSNLETKLIYVNGNHLPENSNITVPNINANAAYRMISHEPLSNRLRLGENIIFIHNRIVYINGIKQTDGMGTQTNYNTNLISFSHTDRENELYTINGISVISEVYKSSDLAHLTEQDCINISKYGLKRYNDNKLIPMREVEKL